MTRAKQNKKDTIGGVLLLMAFVVGAVIGIFFDSGDDYTAINPVPGISPNVGLYADKSDAKWLLDVECYNVSESVAWVHIEAIYKTEEAYEESRAVFELAEDCEVVG